MSAPSTPLGCLKTLMAAVEPGERTHESGVLVKDLAPEADSGKLFDLHGAGHANKAAQSAVARWANGVDSPCAAQTRPPPTNPGRPPLSRCIDVLTESWCATLHQAVLRAQRQDVVVAHQPADGGYFTNQFIPARERKCRQLE